MCLDPVNDEESAAVTGEPDVEYTEVVHPRPVDPARGDSTVQCKQPYHKHFSLLCPHPFRADNTEQHVLGGA